MMHLSKNPLSSKPKLVIILEKGIISVRSHFSKTIYFLFYAILPVLNIFGHSTICFRPPNITNFQKVPSNWIIQRKFDVEKQFYLQFYSRKSEGHFGFHISDRNGIVALTVHLDFAKGVWFRFQHSVTPFPHWNARVIAIKQRTLHLANPANADW